MKMRVIDIFCGAGGFSQGMQTAGHHVVAALDFKEEALAVHAANLSIKNRISLGGARRSKAAPDASWSGGGRRADLADILGIAADIAELNPDIIVGGPPCQPWSQAGQKRRDEDDRADLTEAYGIIVTVVRPRYFVMENVKQVRDSKMYRRMRYILRHAGYGLTEMVINTSFYGSAQSRDRFLCVGALDEVDGWFHDLMTEAKSDRRTTVADILPEFGVKLQRTGSNWATIKRRRAASKRVDSKEGSGHRLRPADIRVLNKAGDSFKGYFRYPGGKSSAAIRRTDEPMPAILESSGGGPGLDYKPGRGDVVDLGLLPVATLDELSQITGFPAGWIWDVKPKHRSDGKRLTPIKMLANAVPPPLAAAIGRSLRKHAQKHIPEVTRPDWKVPKGYVEWLTRTGNLTDDAQTQLVAALRDAKRHLAGHNLPSTRAEIAAFDKVAAFSHGSASAARQSMLSALSSFAEWQAYMRWLPSDSEVRKLTKKRAYLRNCPAPLRANLAALECDEDFPWLSKERQKEYRQIVTKLFDAGDPAPFFNAYIRQDPFFQEDEPDSDVASFSLTRRRKMQKAEERRVAG
jgi:DNA-cytosine methyltransferase